MPKRLCISLSKCGPEGQMMESKTPQAPFEVQKQCRLFIIDRRTTGRFLVFFTSTRENCHSLRAWMLAPFGYLRFISDFTLSSRIFSQEFRTSEPIVYAFGSTAISVRKPSTGVVTLFSLRE